jgi:hypothetical protein
MGEIPADPSIGASEAFSTIENASNNGVDIFLVDLLLPAYDISQGSNLYDEVLAVEYCIELSAYLNGNTSILLRDDKVLQTVTRILNARESTALEEAKAKAEEEARLKTEEEARRLATKAKTKTEEEARGMVEAKTEIDEDDDEDEEDDDFLPATSDIDSFRSQLMSTWDEDDLVFEGKHDDEREEAKEDEKEQTPIQSDRQMLVNEESIVSSLLPRKKRYRLASMFGKYEIKRGPDMIKTVVQALLENGMPTDDENNLIILSSETLEETVAVRSLVAKYSGQKKVILVNCKLDPLPPELRSAETVYSLMPLIGRKKVPGSSKSDEEAPPKVVVLRRYPADWEIYVDAGTGFQLAETIPATMKNKRGIPIEMVTESVKRFLR